MSSSLAPSPGQLGPPPDLDDDATWGTTAKPQANEAATFLDLLWPDGLGAGVLSLFLTSPQRAKGWVEWADSTTSGADVVARHQAAANVWVGAATRHQRHTDGKRGTSRDCLTLPGLWLDVDYGTAGHSSVDYPPTEGDALHLIAQLGPPPTLIVHSGNGLQPWWLFDAPLDAQAADTKRLLSDWQYTWEGLAGRYGWKVDNVSDLARIMRVPGGLNHKNTPPKPVTLLTTDGPRYNVEDLDQHLLARPPQEQQPPTPAPRAAEGELPGERYNAEHTIGELLEDQGWTLVARHGNGDEHWRHPGATNATSGTVYGHSGRFYCWTSSVPQLTPRRTYDAFGLYTALHHGSDFQAAATALGAEYRGTAGATAAPAGDADSSQPSPSLNLPDEFWEARPALAHIRQAAWSRLLSPDAVLGAVLARMAATTPPQYRIPPIVGTAASVALYAALVGPSGAGKSAAVGAAAALYPINDRRVADRPLGSGEGLVELYMGKDEDGKRAQVNYGAFVTLDEGAALTELGQRKGSTVLSTLRSMWSGGTAGQSNASADTSRLLKDGTYTLGLVIGIQPKLAGSLLADDAAGTPQRFLWLQAIDPGIPDHDIDWPGPLKRPALYCGSGHRQAELTADPAIRDELRADRRAVARGEKVIDTLDSQLPVARLKVAALLAMLDGRRHIDPDDWDLANVVMATSAAVRAQAVNAVRSVHEEQEQARDRAAVRRAKATAQAVTEQADTEYERTLDSAAQTAWKVVDRDGRASRRDINTAIGGRRRKVVPTDDVIEHAISLGWLAQTADDGIYEAGPRCPK